MNEDSDIEFIRRQQMKDEIVKLRVAIRKHRDASGHDLCWYNPEMWSLLPESTNISAEVSPTCEFLANCQLYRKSLDPIRPQRVYRPMTAIGRAVLILLWMASLIGLLIVFARCF